MSLTNAAIAELHQLQTECEGILKLSTIGRSEQKRADLLLSRMSSIRSTGVSSDELIRTVATAQARSLGVSAPTFSTRTPEARLYQRWLTGKTTDAELRATTLVTKAENTPTLGYTQGQLGGFTVPMEYHRQIVEGQKLVSPLLNPDVVTVVQEDSYTLRPLQIPEFDLSQVVAVKIGEINQESPASVPTIAQPLLNKFAYRSAFDYSREFDEDAEGYTDGAFDILSRANGIALARGINADLIYGDGSTGPQGIVVGSSDSGVVTAASNTVGYNDLVDLFYSIDPIYRESEKAAFLVSDAVHKQIRKLKDGNQRPLFKTSDGILNIFGKPCYIAPDLPLYNPSLGTQAAGSFAVFGDLSKYVVHCSAVLQRKLMELPGLIEFGKIRLHSLQMVDAVVCNPSPSLPAIVSARLKA
jgi:HK97 family phage major capsid protein